MSNRPNRRFGYSIVHHSPYLPYPDFLLALWYLVITEDHVLLLHIASEKGLRIEKEGGRRIDESTNQLKPPPDPSPLSPAPLHSPSGVKNKAAIYSILIFAFIKS